MLETVSNTIPLISPVITAFVANTDITGGAALVTASAAALIGWTACAVRRRPAADPVLEDVMPAPAPKTEHFVDDLGFTLVTDHPITPQDLDAVDRCLTGLYGPVIAGFMLSAVIACVAADEARDLDTELEQLDGWAR